jgi:hypothetical protein
MRSTLGWQLVQVEWFDAPILLPTQDAGDMADAQALERPRHENHRPRPRHHRTHTRAVVRHAVALPSGTGAAALVACSA